MRVLLADDDTELTTMLQRALDRMGHAVDVVATAEDALWLAGVCEYDAFILDVNLPASDGFTVCQELRTRGDWTPILFLTGRTAVADRVTGLDVGGDDYLAKPFALEELTARLRTISRRQPRQRPTVLEAGDIEVDPATRSVRRASTQLDLAPKEFALLELLVRHAGDVVERKTIHDALWDFAFDPRSNVIDAVVRRLRVSDAPYDDATRAELLTLVADEAERLDRLVANLLNLSRIEAGALRPERQEVALDELVADTVKRLGRVLASRRIRIEMPPLPVIPGDYTQLSQVLSNLLENAARHAPEQSTIQIGARETGDSVELWVEDEGLGVLSFERDQIFEPFRRGKGSTSSGVGLAICKAIVEAHGGRIQVEAAHAGGARFRFGLPKAP